MDVAGMTVAALKEELKNRGMSLFFNYFYFYILLIMRTCYSILKVLELMF